jgi:hypothetical protein
MLMLEIVAFLAEEARLDPQEAAPRVVVGVVAGVAFNLAIE